MLHLLFLQVGPLKNIRRAECSNSTPTRFPSTCLKKQKKGSIEGNDLRKEIVSPLVLNANVLDWLLDHPELIPEEWKRKYIFFWGTIYRGSDDNLYVRYLIWDGAMWDWRRRWLGDDFASSDFPAALAS
ncbi:MAG: hypothetical protein COX77_00545 [Candidatus Komeilibacteria bacterium CG_4_10_14_0_2_um_filter_37_10]|uniref:Uncharacterized protein n=1 Tax=Candidatus Komeilibacteria bacterium CG_4_10_14_0_2_um_filter_37_10 TaxID=1974470 RepID=A0A2M7VGF5_9BACT|nr:MAG: hypothetical protein COX77_00545 [Candidatus Komeilibacteria bacterium CG_4_10_14_0_2_um_filter_37_10]